MENKFMRVEEVAAELGVSASYAYKVIRRLNDELKAKGFVTIAGRINRQYFNGILICTSSPLTCTWTRQRHISTSISSPSLPGASEDWIHGYR